MLYQSINLHTIFISIDRYIPTVSSGGATPRRFGAIRRKRTTLRRNSAVTVPRSEKPVSHTATVPRRGRASLPESDRVGGGAREFQPHPPPPPPPPGWRREGCSTVRLVDWKVNPQAPRREVEDRADPGEPRFLSGGRMPPRAGRRHENVQAPAPPAPPGAVSSGRGMAPWCLPLPSKGEMLQPVTEFMLARARLLMV